MVFRESKISIVDLSLWDENARFPDEYFGKSESELIDYFISSERKFKIKTLAEEVVTDFDLPQMEKLIVLESNDRKIVLEGNRRLTVYKLLNNPTLAPNRDILEFFTLLKAKITIDENFQLECLITEDSGQGSRYLDRKHIKNNNEVSWGDAERAYHNARRGNARKKELFKIAISNYVKALDIPSEFKSGILGRGYVTTFFRIIESKAAWEEYKFEIDDDGNLISGDADFTNKLKIIILQVLQKEDFEGNKVGSRELNRRENIETFIKSVRVEDFPKVDTEIEKKTEHNLFGEKEVKIITAKKSGEILESSFNRQARSRPQPVGLFYSSNIPYRLSDSNLRFVYDELKEINVAQFPNATHDLLRSFLECALIIYFKKIGEYGKIKKSDQHNPKLGEMLVHIINGNCEKITDANLIGVLNQIKTSFDQPYSLERFNMINHNEHWVSTERDVRASWARLEGLFKIILQD
jgi:hypothetical protein